MLGIFNKRIKILEKQKKELEEILHYTQHGLPKPTKMCKKISYISVTKYDNGDYGLCSTGMLGGSEVIKCLKGHGY